GSCSQAGKSCGATEDADVLFLCGYKRQDILCSCCTAEVLWLRYQGPGNSDPGPCSCPILVSGPRIIRSQPHAGMMHPMNHLDTKSATTAIPTAAIMTGTGGSINW